MTTVYVCRECNGHKRLMKFLRAETAASLRCVGCQSVCGHPVAGLVVNGRLEWFSRLDKPKRLVAMAKLIGDHGRGALPATLEKTRSRKRSGRPAR